MTALVPEQEVGLYVFLTCISELSDWNIVLGGCKINTSFLYDDH